jgi:hypothetical protein
MALCGFLTAKLRYIAPSYVTNYPKSKSVCVNFVIVEVPQNVTSKYRAIVPRKILTKQSWTINKRRLSSLGAC